MSLGCPGCGSLTTGEHVRENCPYGIPPRRVHLIATQVEEIMAGEVRCLRCDTLLLTPFFIAASDYHRHRDIPNVATKAEFWAAQPDNCERLPRPAGKRALPLTGNGI